MKILKGISTFLFFSILFGACFDPPTFPVVPAIEFESIVFVEAKTITESDSLNLTISFKDGDGDMGLSTSQINEPFNKNNFFLENNGELIEIGTEEIFTNLPSFIEPNGQPGKLATVRSRQKEEYDTLPPYTIPYSCINYIYDSVYIYEDDKYIFDDTYNLYKTLTSTDPTLKKVYVLLDTFYYQTNRHYDNITVDFLVKQNDGSFKKFDWVTEYCTTDNAPGTSYNGRFPRLSEKAGPLEGTITYSMVSSGFLALFSVHTLQLRITVYDRALNKSNTIYTPEFTLR